jgi:hypothetical protein
MSQRTAEQIIDDIASLWLAWPTAPQELFAELLEELEQVSPQLRYPDTGLIPDGETLR